MKISFTWLQDYISITENVEKIAQSLTQGGLEVGGIRDFEPIQGGLQGLLIGQVMDCYPHPNADQLKITQVDIGQEIKLQIVCGAPNVQTGQKVVVAPIGTKLYSHDGVAFKIKKAKIRGELSEGMLCAEDEIGLGGTHEGIMTLDTSLPCGTAAAQYFNRPSDTVLEIDLTPNRGDACSHVGVARELGILLDRSVNYPVAEPLKLAIKQLPINVKVLDPVACPRYAGVVISNVNVAPSPTWLIDKLKTIGLNTVNNIVDITNFVMHELGQPLHAFDYDRITGKTLKVQVLEQGTSFVTLDGVERKLKGTELMVSDQVSGISMAGVLGGQRTSIHADTRNIFLESAYFCPGIIRKAAKQHALQTDASFRHERGINPDFVLYALKRACLLIQEIAQGEVASNFIDLYPQKIEPASVKIRYKYIKRLLGQVIPQETIQQILNKLEIVIESEDEESLTVSVPSYRTDVKREVDVVEEIARIYGYDRMEIKDVLGSSYLAKQHDRSYQIKHETSSLLVANGYNEIYTNSLSTSSYADLLEKSEENQRITIVNPLSESLDSLRQYLLFGGLEVVVHNLNRKQLDLKLFEFGQTYSQVENQYVEKSRLAIWLTGKLSPVNWTGNTQETTFYDLKAITYKLLQQLGITKFCTAPSQDNFYENGIQVLQNDKLLLTAGHVSQSILQNMHIGQPVFFADIDWGQLLGLQKSPKIYQPISKFPSVKRDISLVLDHSVNFEAVREIIDKQKGKFIQDVTVFDVYQGKELEINKKAYALNLILQDQEKTLDEKTIDHIMKRLFRAFEEQLGATIRT